MINTHSKTIVSVCVFTALVVAVLRFFTLTDLGYDLTVQIQAAQRLLAGHGLTTYALGHGFIGNKSASILTHFPAGYSIYAAFLLWIGIPLYLATKIFGATFTILGWLGWGRFMANCLAPAMGRGTIWTLAALSMAVVLPLFSTPAWDGTDIFLWAAVPWVLTWLAAAPTAGGRKEYYIYAAIGFLCGLCLLMRYASAVLVACVGIIILFQALPNFRRTLARGLAFGVGFFPPVIVQIAIFMTARSAEGNISAGGIGGSVPSGMVLENLFDGFRLLPTWNFTWLFWLPDRLYKYAIGSNEFTFFAYLFLAIGMIGLPYYLYRKCRAANGPAPFQDVKVLASILSSFTPLFLLVCMVVSTANYDYVADRRYYAPLIPLVFLLIMHIGAGSEFHLSGKFAAFGARFTALAFLAISVLGVVFLFLPGPHGNVVRQKLTRDAKLENWGHLGLESQNSPMRNYVIGYLDRNEGCILLTNFEQIFWADTGLEQKNIHKIVELGMGSNPQIDGPRKVLIVAIDRGDGNFYSYANINGVTPALWVNKLPNIRKLETFEETIYPATRIKVLESEIPSGFQLDL
jgi:hypothetical protein